MDYSKTPSEEKQRSLGVIRFPNKGVEAIFKHDIVGQLSDGAWENATPHDHWKFWAGVKTEIGDPHVWAYERCSRDAMKIRYNLHQRLCTKGTDLTLEMRANYVGAMLGLPLKETREILTGAEQSAETKAFVAANPDAVEAAIRGLQRYTRNDCVADLKLMQGFMGDISGLRGRSNTQIPDRPRISVGAEVQPISTTAVGKKPVSCAGFTMDL
ncbi:MAG: hypothetical protein WC786_06600 [Patescibacteria group bacterium]|jgi:hypothetical protein